jgi:hypothetical protein
MHCTLTPDELAARGARWRALGPAHATDLPNGLRLTFPAGVEDELNELARLERDCCAFARWDVTTEQGHAHLDVTADGDAVAAVQSLFPSLRK